jgi:hypothetical protein
MSKITKTRLKLPHTANILDNVHHLRLKPQNGLDSESVYHLHIQWSERAPTLVSPLWLEHKLWELPWRPISMTEREVTSKYHISKTNPQLLSQKFVGWTLFWFGAMYFDFSFCLSFRPSMGIITVSVLHFLLFPVNKTNPVCVRACVRAGARAHRST